MPYFPGSHWAHSKSSSPKPEPGPEDNRTARAECPKGGECRALRVSGEPACKKPEGPAHERHRERDTEREDHVKVQLGPNVKAAVITSNLMPGGALIENESKGDVQIANNAVL